MGRFGRKAVSEIRKKAQILAKKERKNAKIRQFLL